MTTRSAGLAAAGTLAGPWASGVAWPWLEAAGEMAALYRDGNHGSGPDGRWRGAPRVATRTPDLTPDSVATARAFTLRTMQRWHVADRAQDVAAVVSELLTNALRHALPRGSGSGGPAAAAPITVPWPIRLGLLNFGRHVLCAVADPSSAPPVARHPDWQDEGGRGLQVIASLSDQWGYCPAPGEPGKVVWAAFAIGPGLQAVPTAELTFCAASALCWVR